MNFLKQILILTLFSMSALVLSSKAYSANDYSMSCTNTAYDGSLSSEYLRAEADTTQSFRVYGVYTGLDCVYSGGGRTNSSAIVGGEIARSAANAVVGAVTGRLSAAMTMNSDTAAHMSYSTNGGIGMAANHLIGGLSLWTSVVSSNFENDQSFTNVRADSNQFDGDSQAVTFGLDNIFVFFADACTSLSTNFHTMKVQELSNVFYLAFL